MKFLVGILLPLLFAPSLPSFAGLIGNGGYVRRCYKTDEVRVLCEDFSDPVGTFPDRAELQIFAESSGKKYVYAYMRAIENPQCRIHRLKLKKIMKGNSEVCITGWGEMEVQDEILVKWYSAETSTGKVSR